MNNLAGNPQAKSFGRAICWISLIVCGFIARGGETQFPPISDARRKALAAEVAAQSGTADSLWVYLQKIEAAWAQRQYPRESTVDPANIKSVEVLLLENEMRIEDACRDFMADYAYDARLPEVQLFYLAGPRAPEFGSPEYQKICAEILAEPSASAATRARARYLLVMVADSLFRENPEKSEKVFASYERDYPRDALGSYLVKKRVEYYTYLKPENLISILRQLTASPNTASASTAKDELALRIEPLDMIATATNGKTVDVAKMRGKTVLLYFWAGTWGDPDKDILPRVLSLWRQYPRRDLAIVGISLDTDRIGMRRAMKKEGIDWPVINDTKEDGESAIAARFNEALSIPAVWLVGRDGVAVKVYALAQLEKAVASAVGRSK